MCDIEKLRNELLGERINLTKTDPVKSDRDDAAHFYRRRKCLREALYMSHGAMFYPVGDPSLTEEGDLTLEVTGIGRHGQEKLLEPVGIEELEKEVKFKGELFNINSTLGEFVNDG